MTWGTTALRVVLDLLVVGLCLGMAWMLCRKLPVVRRRGLLAACAGLGLVALFHATDFALAVALTPVLGAARVGELAAMLQLEVRGFVTVLALASFLVAIVLMSRDLASLSRLTASRERRQSALIDELPLPAALLSPEGRLVGINALGLSLMRDPDPAPLLGRPVWELPILSGKQGAQLEAAVHRAAAGETVRFNLEDSLVGPAREPAVLDVSLSPIRNTEGVIIELLATASDITTAWQAALESAKAEERFRSLLTHTRDYVFCLEYEPPIPVDLPLEEQVERMQQGVLVECNRQFAEHHGFADVEALLGTRFSEFAPGADDSLRPLLERFVSEGYRLDDAEVEVRQRDGNLRYFANNGHGVVEDGGLVRRWGAFRDITTRVLAEKDLRSALQQIQALKAELEQENLQLREEVERAHGFPEIIGEDPKIEHCLDLVSKVAPTDAAALILGETGTGKELIARAIHSRSQRAEQTLVKVNCAALPTELIESELFGHEKGAFTGAHSRRIGRFELADGGSLFLDEIGDLPFELQGKLLRVLQEGEFERLGGTQTLIVDVRIIAATNKDLQAEVDRGTFRADLFYRINTFPIVLPPLRERRGDIPLLVKHFVDKHAERFARHVDAISPRTLRYLQQHSWPGNIRELEGFVERALLASSGPTLDYVDPLESRVAGSPAVLEAQASADAARHTTLVTASRDDLRTAERDHITRALEASQWVIEGARGASARLGIAPSTLRSKMKRLGIERPSSAG